MSPPIDDRVNYGESAIFTCGAVTDRLENNRLKYIWLKDGVEVDKSDPRVSPMVTDPCSVFRSGWGWW